MSDYLEHLKRCRENKKFIHSVRSFSKAIDYIEKLEQHSISKDELRGLVNELRTIENRDNNPRNQHLVGASLGAGMAADKLNKLIEGDKDK